MSARDERDPTWRARQEVILKYGRLWPDRRQPMFCSPSRIEREGKSSFHRQPDGKVIYDDREKAEAAARELEAITGIAFRPYACPRSRRGHQHLTRDNSPAVKRRQGRGGWGPKRRCGEDQPRNP